MARYPKDIFGNKALQKLWDLSESKEQEITRLREKNQVLEAANDQLSTEIFQAKQDLQAAREDIDEALADIAIAKQDIADLKKPTQPAGGN